MPPGIASHVVDKVDRVLAGDAKSIKSISPYVVDSWQRCVKAFKLDPTIQHRQAVLESAAVNNRIESLGALSSLILDEIKLLHQYIGDSGYSLICTDRNGVILDYVVDSSLDQEFIQAGLRRGAIWDEAHEGTNGIGTCIAEKNAVTIHLQEHFRQPHGCLTCTGIPILDVDGEVIAVLDASAVNTDHNKSSQINTTAVLRISSRRLENWNFLHKMKKDLILRLGRYQSTLERPSEHGLMALDTKGNIKAVNSIVLDAFKTMNRHDLIGRSVKDILDIDCANIETHLDSTRKRPFKLSCLPLDEQIYVSVDFPRKTNSGSGTIVNNLRGKTAHHKNDCKKTLLDLNELGAKDSRMQYNVFAARRVMNNSIPIMLLGETGTGKEAFACAIHSASERKDKLFVPVNCAAIPESLIESELFGYESGAFTGARRSGMRGKIQQSSGGTLFLDEIGDMPPLLQTRLLRVLEEKKVYPLASDKAINVELNVICATNQNIAELITKGIFREDLYYRLAGLTLELVPLRDREDKAELIEKVLRMETEGRMSVKMSRDAWDILLNQPWRGNLRELHHVLRAAFALSDGVKIKKENLPPSINLEKTDPIYVTKDSHPQKHKNPLQQAERETLVNELYRHRFNVVKTAKTLKISRNTLYRKIRRYQIPLQRDECREK